MEKRKIIYSVLILLLFIFNLSAQSNKKIVYGIIPNGYPTTFVDDSDTPTGFFVELFTRILEDEGYEYEIVVDSFSSIYAKLLTGEVDLFTSLSKRPDREDLIYFSDVPSTVSWTEVFINPETDFKSINDIRNKKIALVNDVSYTSAFTKAMDNFDIDFTRIAVKDFEEAIQMFSNNEVYAMVAYSWLTVGENRIRPSGFSFQPIMDP